MRELTARIGIELPETLLKQSLTHRSFAYENSLEETNERLEFLGDSVLGIVITEELYQKYPQAAEGELAKLRAAIVNARALADVAREIGLGEFLMLGKGEEFTGGRDKSSILADSLEALLGAIYLSHGLDKTAKVILKLFSSIIENSVDLGAALDWKTSLSEVMFSKKLGSADYLISEAGPDHDKQFTAKVIVNGQEFGTGTGKSKKTAEQNAAKEAFEKLSKN
ncbi:MAG: ribonuclease III [Candidatus Nanopelagicales bacterium]|jgi:ribonuclease-3